MKTFLQETAAALLRGKTPLKDTTVILPNRRAGLFFAKHLGNLIEKPTWMPAIKTIEELFYDLAEAKPADSLTLLFELYEVYKQLHPSPESFDRFYFWGELMLKDFNDVDQFMVDAKRLYHHLAEIKIMERDWAYLTEHQIELIKAFWKSFEGQGSRHQEKFLKFWEILFDLYDRFKASLRVSGYAYPGMLYREVVEKLSLLDRPKSHHVFVGFNAFTKTEEVLVKHFVKAFDAQLFWDVDDYYISDRQQESGLFFRDYQKDTVFGPTFLKELPKDISRGELSLRSYATPLKITQANLVGSILEQAGKNDAWEDTVVILPDEQMLFPVLNSIPETVDRVNVTMGYPVKNTPVYTFLEAVLELQRYIKREDGTLLFYHKPVKDLLSSAYLRRHKEKFCRDLVHDIIQNNLVYVPHSKLIGGGALFDLVFRSHQPGDLLDGLQGLILELSEQLDEKGLDRSYLFQCYRQLSRLKELFQQRNLDLNLDIVVRIFRQMFREVRLPFEGEPLEGLQVMGVLESRNLDFRRVIICNMNERSFPPGGSMNSMVPFNLRKAFGLPVQEQNDAIYAYTFYRLLHRAEEVHLIYTTSAEQGKASEKSRYIYQVMEELGLPEKERQEETVFVPVDASVGVDITIHKTPEVLSIMDRYVFSEQNQTPVAFSPSALNAWLDCRLKFYFQYIAELSEPNEVNEEVDAAVFGNLVHGAMENLYVGFIDRKQRRTVEKDDFAALEDFISPAIERSIRKQYFLDENDRIKLTGQLAIARDVLQKYILQILRLDKEAAPFEIISLEAGRKYKAMMEIGEENDRKLVALGGIIDRVDSHLGIIRLIDYKSGKDIKQFASIESLFDRNNKKRNKAVLQTMFYGFLFQQNFPMIKKPLKPGIVNIRDIFAEGFSPFLVMKEGRGQPVEIEDYFDYQEPFEKYLKGLLSEIFDQKVSFDQTDDLQKCRYCPYVGLCGR